MKQKLLKKTLEALSLIEISISLMIVGLLLLGAMQGWKWVEAARMSNTVQQVLQIQTAFVSYKQTYYKKPSNADFWQSLLIFGGPKPIADENKVQTSIGAFFEYNETDGNIVLHPLKPAQALHIKQTLDPTDDVQSGWIKVDNDDTGRCIKDKTVDLSVSDKICKIKMSLN